jgi:16S rRNA (guanine(966)-N(2))-methyltransferase RsmD
MFNILNNTIDFESLDVLDLFAGTGSISFEFFSRGCRSVTAVDIDHKCIHFIQHTADLMKADNLDAIRMNCFQFLKFPGRAFDLIFADPPYELEGIDKLPDLVCGGPLLMKDGLFILEHSKDHSFEESPWFSQHRNYGSVNFTFFMKPDSEL